MSRVKPISELTPAYRRRIERAFSLGFSRSQARGHPNTKKGEGLLSKTPPKPQAAGTVRPPKLAPAGWTYVEKSSKRIERNGRVITYWVYSLNETFLLDWYNSVLRLLNSRFGRHKVYRVNYTFMPLSEALVESADFADLTRRRGEGGTTFEQTPSAKDLKNAKEGEVVPGTKNLQEMQEELGDVWQLTHLIVEFRD